MPRSAAPMLAAALVLALFAASARADWASGSEELSGAGLTTQGVKIVLNPSKPKLTVLSTSTACGDGSTTSADCAGQFLMTAIKDLYEVDAAGAKVSNRGAGDVLDLSQGSWTVASEDLSGETNPPLANVSTATFAAPFKASFPACNPAATFTNGAIDRYLRFKVLLFPAATNYTAESGETMEILAGNTKTLLSISGWPFCADSSQLVAELALKSTMLGQGRAPEIRNGSEVEEAAEQLRDLLYQAVDAEESDEEDAAVAPVRRLLARDDKEKGNGNKGGNDMAATNTNGKGSSGSNSTSASNSTTSDAPGSKQKLNRWEALESAKDKLSTKLNNTIGAHLRDKVAARRPVAGLGARQDDRRLYIALPGSGSVDAKLDVPSVAIIDGLNTTLLVEAPAFNKGEGVQRLRLTFPSFAELVYDPVSSFATSDTVLNSELESALEGTTTSATAPRSAACLGVALGAAVAAAGLLLLPAPPHLMSSRRYLQHTQTMAPLGAADARPAKRGRTAAPSRARSPAAIECLPDELLGRVFTALGRKAGRILTLVCRRWHGVFFAEAALWGEVEVVRRMHAAGASELKVLPWFASKRALLRQAGQWVQRLAYLESVETAVRTCVRPLDYRHKLNATAAMGLRLGQDVLATLSPSALTSLQLQLCMEPEPEALAALSSLTALQELTLSCADAPLPPGAVEAFSSLPRLQALQLTAASLPDSLLAALTQLQRLSLDAHSLPDGVVEGLQGLTALTRLECCAHQLPDMQLLCALSQLRHLGWLEQERTGGDPLRPPLQQLLARLPGLQSWTIGSTDGYGGSCMELGSLTLYSCSAEGRDPAASSVRELSLVGVDGRPSLRRAIEAALPAVTQPTSLRSLVISYSSLAAEPLLCPHLAQLTRLCLDDCAFLPDLLAAGGPAQPDAAPQPGQPVGPFPAADAEQPPQPSRQVLALNSLLAQAPRVVDLSLPNFLAYSDQGQLPDTLVCRRGLLRLDLTSNRLRDLPAGPYLRGLESLVLDNNGLTHLPPALAEAPTLASLSVRNNRQLSLTAADVETVGSRLPLLRELYTWEADTHAFRDLASGQLPQLRVIPLRPKEQLPIPRTHEWLPFALG